MKKVWIRTDCNQDIATGHIYRCKAIADKLSEKNVLVEFVFSNGESKNFFKCIVDKDDTFSCHILNSDIKKPEDELEKLSRLFFCHRPDFYFIDSYFITAGYCSAIYENNLKNSISVSVGYIDDLYNYDFQADMVVNYDYYVDSKRYRAKKVLAGVEYAPLRPEFGEVEYTIQDKVERVFLSAGGTDPREIIGRVLDYLSNNMRNVSKDDTLVFDVIVGPFFSEGYKKKLSGFGEKIKLVLHENVTDIWSLMKQSDIAISAGGTSIYELCSIGVPTVAFGMSGNQISFLKGFEEAGLIKYVGDIRKSEYPEREIAEAFEKLCMDYEIRTQLSDRSKKMIDGKGAARIADSIFNYLEESECKTDV